MTRVRTNFPPLAPPKAGDELTAQAFRDLLDSLCGVHTWWMHPMSGGPSVSDPAFSGTPNVTVVDVGSVTEDWQTFVNNRNNTSIHSHFHATLDGGGDKVTTSLWGGTARDDRGLHGWIKTEGTKPQESKDMTHTTVETNAGQDFGWFEAVVLMLPDSGGFDEWSEKTNSITENWGLVSAATWGNYRDVAAGWEPQQVLPPDSPQNLATNSTWAFYPLKVGAWLCASTDALHLTSHNSTDTKEITEGGAAKTLHSDTVGPEAAIAGWSLQEFTGSDDARTYHWHRASGYVAPRTIEPES